MPPDKPTAPICPDILRRFPEPIVGMPFARAVEADGDEVRLTALGRYLIEAGNCTAGIARLHRLLRRTQVILEIGCGDAGIARRIALQNPHMAMVATDAFHWEAGPVDGSRYQAVALSWKERQLAAQHVPPDNLAILRAQVDMLRHLPARSVDSLLMIHPEPRIGRDVLDRLADEALHRALKPGVCQIVVLPFSRELGVYACGGCEFEHDPDWSRGLGFLMSSRFRFGRGDRIQWGVDLPKASRYTSRSTQSDVYVAGV